VRERMRRIAEGHEVGLVEEKLVDTEGNVVHAEVSASRVLYQAGRPRSLHCGT
jgi:hypothetical protein